MGGWHPRCMKPQSKTNPMMITVMTKLRVEAHADVVAGLDNQTVRSGTRVWHLHADSQRVDEHRWVRVTLSGGCASSVLLKVALTAQARDAVRALQCWLIHPGHEDGDVIEVD